jgi:hypothetical protein
VRALTLDVLLFFAVLQGAIYGVVAKRIVLQQFVNFAIPILSVAMVLVVENLRLPII